MFEISPLPGGPLGPGFVTLKIEALIRAEDSYNSQIMAVQILDASPDLDGSFFSASRTVVVKIYARSTLTMEKSA